MAARRLPEGPAPDPAVMRLRVRYAKRGRMRFTSTRDFQRALERAVRRAGLPVAFSAGFHPHPKISYANAAPTGTASEAEYVEVSLTRRVDPDEVVQVLDEALPDGLDVVEVADAASLPGALADHLQGSLWALRLRGSTGSGGGGPSSADGAVDPRSVRQAVEAVLATEELTVTRMMKKGPRELDVRAAVLGMEVAEGPVAAVPAGPGDVVVLAAVRHTVPTVRPEELWTALSRAAGTGLPRPLATRLRQGPVVGDRVVDLPG
ncbi:TIGR03936 family radical SAM-associated protein [uncultured Ornithinimicrobium sp.]|uniref:TIGR03936 family radical SAM-associated protein n=1 Tax=uncultured Ornithinimicrobium sp. TaxID=259307 RepID=UPI0025936FDF|nr:TIGR03936 family radical SAM-associated protein [uncultured Ornithinimicrobium sp.]